jgi:FMN reductase
MTQDSMLRILGLRGTTREGSTSERAARSAVEPTESLEAQVDLRLASELTLPAYAPERNAHGARADRLMELMRNAGVVVSASLGFPGGPSGLIGQVIGFARGQRAGAEAGWGWS